MEDKLKREFADLEPWEMAKAILYRWSSLNHLDARTARDTEIGTWTEGRKYQVTRNVIEFNLCGFFGEASWGFVKDLKKIVYSKAVIFNNKKRVVFEKVFVKDGNPFKEPAVA